MAEVLERTDALVSAIVSSDMTQLYSRLSHLSIGSSSGVLSLVNAPDAEAWSRGPDALRDQASNDSLYRFVLHLVRNLRAPLQALDDNNETCVHIAAEHGDSAEILRAMLDSDLEHIVSEMRNSRG